MELDFRVLAPTSICCVNILSVRNKSKHWTVGDISVKPLGSWTYTVQPIDSWTYTVKPIDSWTYTVQPIDSCSHHCQTIGQLEIHCSTNRQLDIHCSTITVLVKVAPVNFLEMGSRLKIGPPPNLLSHTD